VARRFGQARALALDVSPLRESVPFRALWIGQVVSLAGSQMRSVAIPFQVFDITDSVVAVGMIGLVEVVPLIMVSLVAGAIADRRDRRWIMARAHIGLILTAGMLAALSFGGSPPLWAIYVITGVSASIDAIDRPARVAIVPSLVPLAKIPAALALRQVSFQTTQIVGPAIAGLMIAAFPLWIVYAIDAVSFTAALMALRWVPPSIPEATQVPQRGLDVIREGLSFIRRDRVILSVFVVDLIAMIFGMPRAVFPALAKRTFGIGAAGLGLLYTAPAVGALLGALTTGWVSRVSRRGRAVLIAVGLWGVFILLAGMSSAAALLIPTLVFLALAGWSDVISAVFRGTILQEATPDRLRGRVSASNIMVVTGGPRLGDVEAGIAAGILGAPLSVVVGGAACVVLTLALSLTRPLRGYKGGGTSATPPEEERGSISPA
jgi:MFS family permease